MTDLAVLGQDPGFGGGAAAMTTAFIELTRGLGRDPDVLFVPHPSFDGARSSPLDRVEALRILRGSRRLVPALEQAGEVWVVAALATHGYAAARSGRPYTCWLATSLADENRGRLPGLPFSRRVAAQLNAPALSRLERAVLRGAKHVYGISAASRASLVRAGGLQEDQVDVLAIPVDLEHFAPEPDEQWLARLERPVLTFIGRADDPRKNVALALEALPLVRARLPEATLQLVGRRPSRRLPEGATALGEIPSVAEPLRRSALLLLPSRQEGFGIVTAEALAAGVPVVATRSGGPEQLLRESGGGVVLDGWEPQELADAIVALLEDRDRLLELRRRGRAYVQQQHAPAVIAERLRQALDG